ncbi:MAG: ADP-ribosylglycohydrolase family protein [Thermoanaerobaculia bacterium]|nr:ADP-ribosylglycohydrolase family protein [Thermoanaerobaculia bacterium]
MREAEAGTREDRTAGGLLGLALGDALGAPHEGDPIETRPWWTGAGSAPGPLRWTDDTQMALVLAEHLVEHGEVLQDELARSWAETCDPRRGYGMGALRLLRRVRSGADWRNANRSVFEEGSYGNGAAMRAAPLGLRFAEDPATLDRATVAASEITHAHPLGIEGALLLSRAAALALTTPDPAPDQVLTKLRRRARQEPFRRRLDLAGNLLGNRPAPEEIVGALGNSVVAHRSVVTAIYCFLRHRPDDFLELQETVVSLGGDVDTLGAMSGALWGAVRGLAELPGFLLERLEARDRLEGVGRRL